MGHNLISLKDNCALFAPTPLFGGPQMRLEKKLPAANNIHYYLAFISQPVKK